MVELRNDITHYGYIPSSEETINFGNIVLNIQREIIQKANEKDPLFWNTIHSKEITEKKEKNVPTDAPISTLGGIFNINSPFFMEKLTSEVNLNDELKNIEKIKKAIEGAS